jgi:hypothetical protein
MMLLLYLSQFEVYMMMLLLLYFARINVVLCWNILCWNAAAAVLCDHMCFVYVNCCGLFLNELPVSPEVSIHFCFS